MSALDRVRGVADARSLLRFTSRRALRRAARRGEVMVLGRGSYALPTADEARRAAAALHGVVCLRSAAAVRGWLLKSQPEKPEVAVAAEEPAAVSVRGAGATAVRRVLDHADERAQNPFESVLRALCINAELAVRPQLALDLGSGVVHPDLVCREQRAVLEADSWTHHATRSAHTWVLGQVARRVEQAEVTSELDRLA